MSRRAPAQKPVDIPDHLHHGTSYVYRWYRCRCRRCQDWRRSYDRNRDDLSRRGAWAARPPYKRPKNTVWYVCAQQGVRFRQHDYLAGQCLRCDAKQAIEEFWERKWSETQ